MAVSPTLPPLRQPPATELAGFVEAYYLPQEDLVFVPAAVNGAIRTELLLKPGAVWRQLPVTRHTLKLDESPKRDRQGTRYIVKVTATRPTPTPEVLAALQALDRRRLVLLVREQGGSLRLVGDEEEFVQLLAGTEGHHPGTRAGVDLRLEGETTRRAPYYLGYIALTGGGTVAPPAAATGQVIIRDRAGRTMLVAPAGSIITVRSGFRVAFSIE